MTRDSARSPAARAAFLLAISSLGFACNQAHSPRAGSTRTEDVSQVVYNYRWLKDHVLLRNLQARRLEGNLLQVTAQMHSTDAHTSREVRIRTEFYSPPLCEGGTVVDATEWQPLILEPRKRVQYEASSLKPADDFRIYVTYGRDLGQP